MKIYSTTAITDALDLLAEHGYGIVSIAEGVLGHGHVIALDGTGGGYEIQEIALNEWSSGHTIRHFSKVSKRISALLEKAC